MKMTFEKMLERKRELSTMRSQDLPVKVKISIARTLARMEEETRIYERERVDIITKYALRDESGKVLTRTEDDKTIFDLGDNKEKALLAIAELNAVETEVDVRMIQESDLDALSIEQIAALDWMIDYDEETE
jgi:hypothetical protein